MPAKRFFAMLTKSRDMESKKHSYKMIELCDVVAISFATPEYQKELKAMYQSRIHGGSWSRGATVKFDHKDPTPAQTLGAILKQKSRLEGLRG